MYLFKKTLKTDSTSFTPKDKKIHEVIRDQLRDENYAPHRLFNFFNDIKNSNEMELSEKLSLLNAISNLIVDNISYKNGHACIGNISCPTTDDFKIDIIDCTRVGSSHPKEVQAIANKLQGEFSNKLHLAKQDDYDQNKSNRLKK